ncbi:MAG: DEAD/DEAH box helicase [Paraclostridium sp.]
MLVLNTQLYDHQMRCVEKLRRIKIGALYLEMGTGKTRTALELIKIRLEKGRVNHVLWLCPCSVKETLRRDIIKHTGSDCSDIITICGIETLSSSIRVNSELLEMVEANDCYLIVDESNLVKNHMAKRTQNIIRLAEKCKYKLILNGTPISRNETDLYAQWYILDWRVLGYKSYWSFAANHIEYDENIRGKLRRVLNIDYLVEKIAPYTYQVTKSECLDLPDKSYETIYFDLEPSQLKHYEYIKDIYLDNVDEFEETTIYRLFNALQQILSGKTVIPQFEEYVTYEYEGMNKTKKVIKKRISGTHKENFFNSVRDNPRIGTLLDTINSISEKVIIFCKYTDEINNIVSILNEDYGEGAAVAFNGDLNLKNRHINLEKFRNEARFLVANKTCAGYGLNLQFCSYVIYYSNDWDYATRAQSEDRVHRIGQDKNVHIIDICAVNKLDERILECLLKKERLIDNLKAEIEDKKDIKQALENWITVKNYNGKNKSKKIKSLDKSDLVIQEG